VAVPTDALPTVAQIACSNNLIATYYDLKSRAGQAPGPDNLTYDDLAHREVADLFRLVSAAVLVGDYELGPTRPVPIPKLKGDYRTLHLANLIDRVLSAALNRALQPFWETVFLPWSMGFRPGHNNGTWCWPSTTSRRRLTTY
jgi:hypothetical protein